MIQFTRARIWTRRLRAALPTAFLYYFTHATIACANAVQLVGGIDVHGPIQIDANDGFAYFGQLHISDCSGEMDRVSINGGGAGVVATGLSGIDGGTCRGLNEILFSTDPGLQKQRVLFSWSIGNASGTMAAADLSGSNRIDLVSAVFEDLHGAYQGKAYYPSGFNFLSTVPVGGGSPQNLVSGYFIRSISFDLPNSNYPSGSDGIYFTNYYDKSVYRSDLIAGGATAVIQGMPDEGVILTDSRNVYLSDFSDGNRLIVEAKGASCTVPNCLSLFSGTINGFVVDESERDNPNGSVFVSEGSNLWRVSKSGTSQLMHAGTGIRFSRQTAPRFIFSMLAICAYCR